MSAPELLPLEASGPALRARLPSCRWFTALSLHPVAGGLEFATGDEETCVLLLGGTFDLQGGGTAWPSRGARSTPLQGRPLAVFLPPRTPFRARSEQGELLRISARQPQAPPPTGRQALQHKPLLPLAGSGKAFDPGTGEWRPAETFPSAAESLPPRRIARVVRGPVTVERVFAEDYKAATLTVDEAVLPAGGALALQDLPLPRADECLVFARAEQGLQIAAGGAGWELSGTGVLFWPDAPGHLRLTARDGPAYVALAYAGK